MDLAGKRRTLRHLVSDADLVNAVQYSIDTNLAYSPEAAEKRIALGNLLKLRKFDHSELKHINWNYYHIFEYSIIFIAIQCLAYYFPFASHVGSHIVSNILIILVNYIWNYQSMDKINRLLFDFPWNEFLGAGDKCGKKCFS